MYSPTSWARSTSTRWPFSSRPRGAVHLCEEAGDRGLAGAGVADEDEMLRGRDLRQPVLEAPALHLQEGGERAHLLLDAPEADQRVEFGLELGQR